MRYYSAYNLRIGSEIPLPEFAAADRGGDVEVRLRKPAVLGCTRSINWNVDSRSEVSFCYPRAGQFLVRRGESVEVTPEPEVDVALLRLYVQGMMFAALLHQRGLFVLHASIVHYGSRAIGFVGPVGAGKSTLAAGFHARGYPVAADDNAAIDLKTSPPSVLPAFPSLKIYPDVAVTLGYSRSALQLMHASQTKRAHSVADGFAAETAPLHSIYVLDRQATPGVERLSTVETIVELIRHSVPTRWGVTGDGRHLTMCSRLAAIVPVFRVRTFRSLEEIPGVIDGIEEHLSNAAAHAVERTGM